MITTSLDVFDFVVFGILVVLAVNAMFNACFFPKVRHRAVKPRVDGALPKVSVLVPARNEAHQIDLCLESLESQTYPNYEVIVLNDCSEDGTGDLVRDLGYAESEASDRRLIQGEALPRGWAGKPWACHQLARVATGEFYLFTDADTVHHKKSVESAVAMALRSRTHLLSVWPHQITLTWSEKLVIPMVYLMAFAFIPFWFLRLAQASPALYRWVPGRFWDMSGVANGQFLLFTRDAYEKLGGHESVKDQLVEDVGLGREVVRRLPRGWRLLNADGHQVVECRMYRGFAGVWEGFSKNLRPVFSKRWSDFLGVGVVLLATMVLPFFFFLAREHPWLVTLHLEMILLIRLLLTVRFRTAWLSVWLHPFAVLLTLGVGINSWWVSRTGQITWKRRGYAWEANRASEIDPLLDDFDR